jgi:putative ABC transport system permease protein
MNSVWGFGWRLSKPHQGHPIGKSVRLDNEDMALARALPVSEFASGLLSGDGRVRRGVQRASFSVLGVMPGYELVEKSELVEGRFLTDDDQRERRKVAIIGVKVKKMLWGEQGSPVGDTFEIGRSTFLVVGVFDEETEESEQQTIYVPLSTAQLVFAWGPRGPNGESRVAGNKIERFVFTVGDATTTAQTNDAMEQLRGELAARKGFAPDDKEAVRMFNVQEVSERFHGLFTGIRTFVWLIGLGTILAGVVGVSNIMLISVQERTREIGVRKAVGAPPSTIIAMILQEALAITLVSGYMGLVAGVALVTAARKVIPPATFFRNPDVDIRVGLAATAVLVVSGMLAGLFPALRAARVNPIAALRVE